MTNALQPISSKALAVFANATGKSIASTTRDTCAQALMFLAGLYGTQFQPAANAVLAWSALLADAPPADIAEAVLAYVHSPARDASGLLYARFPPSAPDIYALVRAGIEARQREEAARAVKRERAKSAFDERKRRIEDGTFLTIDPHRQEYLNAWAAEHRP